MDDGATPRPRQTGANTAEAAQLQWLMMGTGRNSIGTNAGVAPGGIVSVDALKVPSAAIKEMQKFFKDFDAGKLDSSVRHLTKAIEIHPEWAAAHHTLGQTYARMGDYDKAVVEFQKAAELDARPERSWVGLATVYFLKKSYADGESAARRALEIDPLNVDARYFLARNLVGAGKTTDEAVELLTKSKERFAVARLLLANIHLRNGKVSAAVEELRGYVAQPGAEQKAKVECMVRHLTEPAGTVACPMQ